MTNKEILEKALHKAIKNGCPYSFIDIPLDKWIKHNFYYAAIFSHDFAKAFWGEGTLYRTKRGKKTGDYVWEHHLKQMIVAKEPLKYIEKFLEV